MSTDWMYDVLALCIVFMNLRILIMIVEKIKLANMLCLSLSFGVFCGIIPKIITRYQQKEQ